MGKPQHGSKRAPLLRPFPRTSPETIGVGVTIANPDGTAATLHLETLWTRDLTITMAESVGEPAREEALAGAA